VKRSEEILNIISDKKELDFCDFKSQYYSATKNCDLIKDVVAMANNIDLKDKYLIFGVDNSGVVLGIDVSALPDISSINQLFRDNVEPFINLEWETIRNLENTGFDVAALVISLSNTDYPYMMKKDYSKNGSGLSKGAIYIRKGATNMVVDRMDLDNMYNLKKEIIFEFIDDKLSIKKIKFSNTVERLMLLNLSLVNRSEKDKYIQNAKVKLEIAGTVFECDGKYIENKQYSFAKVPKTLNEESKKIAKEVQLFKTLYVEISEGCIRLIEENSSTTANCTVQLKYDDGRQCMKVKEMNIEVEVGL